MLLLSFVFIFNDTPTTAIYTYCHTRSLHAALPISMGLDSGEPLEVNRAADGSALTLSTLHRRMRLDATSDAMGLPRSSRDVEEAPEPAHAGMYDRILGQLRDMVPRIEDRSAASSAKAIARQLKYLRELDRSGEVFGAQELDDLEIGRAHV